MSQPPLPQPPSSASSASAGLLLGGYRILGRIARGSTADIFLAEPHLGGDDTPAALVLGLVPPGKRVALKRLYPHLAADEDFVRMFVDEVQLMSRFKHPHILGVHDLDDDGDSFFAVLELVDGPSLSAALRLHARQPGAAPGLGVAVAVAAAAAVAKALDAVHSLVDANSGTPLALVHRDVNPQNVLVGRDGAVKLADFGVARSVSGRTSGVLVSRETTGGTRKGKASYLSPEQVLGRHPTRPDQPIDQRSDLYALGATLWCLLTGRPPFVADSEVALFDTVLSAPTPVLADVGIHEPAIATLLTALLDKDPDSRPPNAAIVAAELQGWLAARGIAGATTIAEAVMRLGLPSLAA